MFITVLMTLFINQYLIYTYRSLGDNISQFQHPKCITVQTSFAMNSSIPQVPTKSTVISTNEDDEDYIETSQYIITTNEQFENIVSKDERKSEDSARPRCLR